MHYKFKLMPFITRWFFSTNHKDIGTLYLLFSLLFGLIGTLLYVIIRIQLSFPGYLIVNYHTSNVIVTARYLTSFFIMIPIFIFIFTIISNGKYAIIMYQMRNYKEINMNQINTKNIYHSNLDSICLNFKDGLLTFTTFEGLQFRELVQVFNSNNNSECNLILILRMDSIALNSNTPAKKKKYEICST